MGLDIKNYHYSYSTLHKLRQAALDFEDMGIPIMDFYMQNKVGTSYPEFVNHCDCEGYYISKTSKQYNSYVKKCNNMFGTTKFYLGDLDKLKEEIKELDNYMKENLEGYYIRVWSDFYNDVISCRKILEFH